MIYARVTSSGMVTLPMELRKLLKLKPGDKILFIENEKGEIFMRKALVSDFREIQKTFKDLRVSEEEILSDVMDLRKKKRSI